MISCLLIQISRNTKGLQPARRESIISGESLQIGRSISCKIQLLDHRVSLIHATIKHSENGEHFIEGKNGISLKINGSLEPSATLLPGTRVEIGPYLLVVETAPAGCDIAISVEMIQPLPEQEQEKISQPAPLALADLGVSKLKLGFAFAACITLLFLLLPMLPGISSTFDKWQATLPVTATGWWSPGPLAGGHRAFGTKCSTCHQHPFKPVPDDACLDCHKQVVRHLSKSDLHSNVFKKVRCTSCHMDHIERAGLILHSSSGCVSCHGDIKRKNPDATRGNTRDFGELHPPFHITLRDGAIATRVPQKKKEVLVEKSHLKYSHQVHLVKKGVSSPLGRTVMICQDCHKIDEAGTHFLPMTMHDTCQQSRCHSLYFTEPVEGIAPHGSEREVMSKVHEFYTKRLADLPAKNRPACAKKTGAGDAAQHLLGCANVLAQKYAAATLFNENGEDLECGLCHEIEPNKGDNQIPWKITLLQIIRDWQPGAVFAHSKHDTVDCTECHDKVNSKSSSDISLPNIEKCRECHGGNRPGKGKIRSTCDSCHRFHSNVK